MSWRRLLHAGSHARSRWVLREACHPLPLCPASAESAVRLQHQTLHNMVLKLSCTDHLCDAYANGPLGLVVHGSYQKLDAQVGCHIHSDGAAVQRAQALIVYLDLILVAGKGYLQGHRSCNQSLSHIHGSTSGMEGMQRPVLSHAQMDDIDKS